MPCLQSHKKDIASAMAATFLFAVIFVAVGVHAKREYTPTEECGLWLAPSAIPGAGLGMYAGSAGYKKDSLISDGDLMVQEWDMDFNNGDDNYHNLWNEYTWSAGQFAEILNDDSDDIKTLSVASCGFGAAINCMLPLVNVHDEWDDEDNYFRMTRSGVSSDSPGAGAFTHMTGRRFMATATIPPFTELYASYGEDYFMGRDAYDFVPFQRHYYIADELIKSFVGNVTLWQQEDETEEKVLNSPSFEQELWDFIVQLRNVWDKSRTMFALPSKNSTSTLKDLKELLDFGGSSVQTFNDTMKNQEWMDEEGQCMDNIRDGMSEIPHAGRGAFASRLIFEGDLVSPAPLIHIPNASSLIIFDHYINEEGSWDRDVSLPSSHQLMLNYCFGHRDSTLLLCPYGYLNFHINHNHKNPNTKVVWTEKRRLRHPEWFDMPIKDWGNQWHSGLALDFVALRDIEKGEEITIDYGVEWEMAWQEHVRNFDTPRVGYKPSYELNEMVELRIPTKYEPIENQFNGVNTFCRSYYFPENLSFTPYVFGTDEDKDETVDWHYTCRVLMRHDDDNYTVEIFHRVRDRGEFDVYETYKDTAEGILFNVPRHAMFFRDIEYSRDYHQPWAFRHSMGLPDEMFPDIWKNKIPKESSTEGVA